MSESKRRHSPYRVHVAQRIYDWINHRHCLHVDAWLYQMPNDELYFVVISAVAGSPSGIVDHVTLRSDATGLVPVANISDIGARGVQRHIAGPWARKNAPWLGGHADALYGQMMKACARYKRRSIMLRYVWTDRRIDDPMEGLENLYASTGRAARDAVEGVSVRDARRMGPIAKPVQAWSADERSLLRTLGKLLS